MKTYWMKTTFFMLVLSGCALAQSDATSLGDIARQNRHGKKKATIVLSDEDQRFSRSATSLQMTSSSAPQAAVTGSNSASVQPSPKIDASKAAKPGEAKDAPSSISAKQKLDFYKSELESWKGITKRDEGLLANETVPFRQQMYQDALDGDRQTMAFFQQKVDESQNEINKSQKEGASSPGGK
jgi:hypothetical protein